MLPIKMLLFFVAAVSGISAPSFSLFPLSCPSAFYFSGLLFGLFGRLLLTEMHENRNNAKFMAHKT